MYDHEEALAAFERAVSRAGTARALAAKIGVSPQRLSDVRCKISVGKKIPADWAIKLEDLYGINKSVFNPTYWPESHKHEEERE